jgi:hypothetical protein
MSLPSYFYDVNIFSVAFRLFLAVLYGGIIGLERGTTRRPAGFRTHILVCVGAALAMLTNQYICETGLYSPADPSRLGAQVITGVGLGKSIQKTLYLPEPQNDFIFAIIGEELGFIGCLILIACYIVLIWRGVHIALNAPDLFGTLLASGITIMLALQVILNIAVVTSSMPPTGITLPFISYGGNALMLFMGSMGILLNISRHSAR